MNIETRQQSNAYRTSSHGMPIRRLISSVLLSTAIAAGAAEPSDEGVAAPAGEAPAPDAIAVAAPATANPLDVAAHEVETGEFQDAEVHLNAVIADIEHQSWRYDPALAHPLTLLGDALSGQGKYAEALPAYEQARHVLRVNDGLHTPSQIEVVYREAATLAAMGETAKANAREEYAYETLLRNYDRYDEAIVPGVLHLAGWYEQTSNIFAARDLYEYAVLIEARAHGQNDPRLIPALQGLARTYREERYPPYQTGAEDPFGPSAPGGFPTSNNQTITVNRFGLGEEALAQIVRITAADPNASPLDLAVAELNYADWFLLFDKDERAFKVYAHARQLMRTKAALSEDQIAGYFNPPHAIWLPIADPLQPEVRTHPTEGYVEINYTLTAQGECRDLKTVDSKPAGMMDTKVRRGLGVARFRPQFDGDTPISVPNMVYRHTFTYYPHPPAPAARTQTPAQNEQQNSDEEKDADDADSGA